MSLPAERKALLQIHFCVLLWGFTAILGKLISLPALELVWWRMLIVVAVLLAWPPLWRELRAVGSRTLAVLPTVEQRATAVHDAEALTRAIAGSDVVINLVGILNESGFSGRGFAQAHTELVRKTLAACAANGVTRFIQMSSLGASESAPSHYLRSKGAAESLIREAPPALRWTIFRPSVIFGTHDSLVNRFAGLLRLTGGLMPLARAEARFAPVWVGDVTQAFEIALQDPSTIGQSYDLCGADIVTLADLVRLTGRYSGTPARVIPLPDVIGRMQARVMDFVPGKPFSSDNFRSLTVDNVCETNGLARLRIRPASMASIVPTYLGGQRADRWRRAAGR